MSQWHERNWKGSEQGYFTVFSWYQNGRASWQLAWECKNTVWMYQLHLQEKTFHYTKGLQRSGKDLKTYNTEIKQFWASGLLTYQHWARHVNTRTEMDWSSYTCMHEHTLWEENFGNNFPSLYFNYQFNPFITAFPQWNLFRTDFSLPKWLLYQK
jgi:hypothetical protein